MTTWTDQGTATTKLTGRYAGHVRVGRFLVHKHVFVEWAGPNGDPDLQLRCEWRDGRPRVVEMTIASKPDGRGVRTSDLEQLRLDTLARNAFRDTALVVTEESPGPDGVTRATEWTGEHDYWELDGGLAEAIASRRGAQNRAQSAAELSTVAEIFNEQRGRAALKMIAERLEVSERTAARRVKAARAAGLIPEAPTSEETS